MDATDRLEATLARVRGWLAAAQRVVVLSGAGISTDSGIPDFRGPKGVWTRNPLAEKMSNIQYYMSDPEVRRAAWKSRLESGFASRKPNAGHHAVAELERSGRLLALITQNVDGLHQAAGNSGEKVIEIHGTSREVMCMSCGERAPIERALDRVRKGEDDPPCRSCGGILKSATISFGQSLIEADLERAERAAQQCDLMLAVGSTLAVYPVAAAVPMAKRAGARVVILNGEPTVMDSIADAVLHGSISEILPRVVGVSAASG